MDRAELEKLVVDFGGDLDLWPSEAAAAARQFAAVDAEAAGLLADALAEEEALDAALASMAAAPAPRPEVAERMLADFLQVAAHNQVAAASISRTPEKTAALGGDLLTQARGFVSSLFSDIAAAIGGRAVFAGGVSAAAAFGLMLGLFGASSGTLAVSASESDTLVVAYEYIGLDGATDEDWSGDE
ncbi:MAG: hypothetical protein MRY74_00630 [Neomegalonema sp.]|nr:hypothetical protein [Neomegalonema sp.]